MNRMNEMNETCESESPSVYDFETFSRKKHLTIRDVKKLKRDEKLSLFFLAPEFIDAAALYVLEENERQNFICIEDMAKKGYGFSTIFKKKDGLKGRLLWKYKGKGASAKDVEKDFEFDVCVDDQWYRLRDGKIPRNCAVKKYRGKSWNELGDTTRIGWRGPALRMSELANFPKLTYDWKT